ncbi:hypothetical protein HY485_04925 [Candidatus Woesearchaeota archaeon]|nr:hypothetical protein [Candidatus Woesearchaeota archaeon]
MESQSFFSATKEKLYIVFLFVAARWLLGYLNHVRVAAKVPFFVNMFLAAVDLVVSLPMKIVFATASIKAFFGSQFGIILLFCLMVAYWYLFACVLVRVYDQLNKQDESTRMQEPPKEEVQAKLS